jgi:alpha-beta hydrolase superfamily lysophospholipase
MVKYFSVVLLVLLNASMYSQKKGSDYTAKNVMINHHGRLFGTLQESKKNKANSTVALIIAGSGPTDRNGNSSLALQTNCLRMLADSLSAYGISSLRFDKRGVGESADVKLKEADLRFTTYVEDAAEWAKYLTENKKFKNVFVVGHSEGSLIGMLVCQKVKCAGFISLAGPGRNADELLVEQLQKQNESMAKDAAKILAALRADEPVKEVSPMLQSLFRPSVQPYMKSWISLNPAEELKKLNIPVQIINGSTDVQVSSKEAQLLSTAMPAAELKIIEGMSHILKSAPADYQENIKTYFQPELPLHPDIARTIYTFILKHNKNL